MKKNGKKWCEVHPINNNMKESSFNSEKAQAEKLLRQTPISKAHINGLREGANDIVERYAIESKRIHEEHKIRNGDKIISPNELAQIILESPIYRPVLLKPLSLETELTGCYKKMIAELNSLFDVAKKEKLAGKIFDRLVSNKYDVEKYDLSTFGKQYVDILCNVVEGTTWHSRKNTEQMLIKIFTEFDKAHSR